MGGGSVAPEANVRLLLLNSESGVVSRRKAPGGSALMGAVGGMAEPQGDVLMGAVARALVTPGALLPARGDMSVAPRFERGDINVPVFSFC